MTGFLSRAQYKQVEFGQNRVQHKNFDWQYYGTENYEVHFYRDGEEYAQIAMAELDEDYEAISDMIGYSPFAKAQIFVYNNHRDLLQSNVGVGQPTFTIAGETRFVKLMLEAAYAGSVVEFRKELKYKTTKMLMDDMMFGGTLGEVFQNSYLLHMSEWFLEGATRYVAYGWDIEMDDYVRDHLLYKKLRPFKRLEGETAALVGQSVWNYIAVRYGKSNLSNILNLTRIIRNEEVSIASSLGISFEQFMFEWADYYGVPMEALNAAYIEPTKEDRIVKTFNKDSKLTKMRVSPDGTKLAYVQNTEGKYKIVIKNLENGRENVAHRGGYTLIDQENSFHLPLIAWANDHQLGIVEKDYNDLQLVTFDLNKGNKQKKTLRKFNMVNDLSYNDNGKLAIISAETKGQTDLFLLSTRKNAIKRLTKDGWDDLHPRFIPGTDAIVFSSNRTIDSLRVPPESSDAPPDVLNLFAYDLDTTRTLLKRLTNTLSNDKHPVALDKDNVYYLSDLKGINNMYKYSFVDDTYTQITNFRTSMTDYDINQYTKDLAFLMLNKGQAKIYLNRNYDLEQTVFPPSTLRQQVRQVEYLREKRESQKTEELFDELKQDWEIFNPDSVVAEEFSDEYALSINYESTQNELNAKNREAEEGFLNLNNYVFQIPEDSSSVQTETIEPIGDDYDPLDFLFAGDTLGSNFEKPQGEATIMVPEDDGYINLNNYVFGQSKPVIDTKTVGGRSIGAEYDPLSQYYDDGQFELDSTIVQTPADTILSPDHFQFEEEIPEEEDKFSFLSIYLKMQEEPEVVGPLPFVTSFSIDNLVTSMVFDQYRGFGILMETQMSDLLDNHRFNGGMMFITDFQSGDFFAEYKYLKNPIDYHARYDRRVIFKEGDEPFFSDYGFRNYIQKYKMNTFTIGASLPTSVATRFEGDVFMAFTEGQNLHPDVLANSFPASDVFSGSSHDYGGYRLSWVFDRTVSNGLNLFEGARGKLTYEQYECFTDERLSFRTLSADIRRYQKIHKELILAGRIYYARSLGNNPRTYMLGGMDNWIGSSSDNTDNLDTPLSFSNHKDNSEVLFSEFVNLRGFDLNRFSGENVLTGSAELRWPIVQYFSTGAIKSDFLRNLMFIGFYDIGSAWTGPSPFEEGNSVDTREVGSEESIFTAVVRTTRNPWLASYGFGVRTALLGYYARFDFAKPIEDYRIGNMKFYVTIGYDF